MLFFFCSGDRKLFLKCINKNYICSTSYREVALISNCNIYRSVKLLWWIETSPMKYFFFKYFIWWYGTIGARVRRVHDRFFLFTWQKKDTVPILTTTIIFIIYHKIVIKNSFSEVINQWNNGFFSSYVVQADVDWCAHPQYNIDEWFGCSQRSYADLVRC